MYTLKHLKTAANALELASVQCPVITVGGTNGKGSTLFVLEHLYRTAGFKVGAFTSPYFAHPRELIRLNGEAVSKTTFSNTLATIKARTTTIPLSDYECYMLSALQLFKTHTLDIMLLEVCMGGRDDVTNIIDPTCAIITNVSLDHCEYLGNTVDEIASIKAGIFRRKIPVIIGERQPSPTLLNAAESLECKTSILGRNFDYTDHKDHWSWYSKKCLLTNLKKPQLYLNNVATAIKAAEICHPVLLNHLSSLETLTLTGRCQWHDAGKNILLDVAHNPASAKQLAGMIQKEKKQRTVHAVFSIYADKNIQATVDEIKHIIDQWHIAPLRHHRAAGIEKLESILGDESYLTYRSIEDAYQGATRHQDTLIVCFGSFSVVKAVLTC